MNQRDREHIRRHAEESLAEPRVYKPLLRIQALAATTLGLLAELERVEAERDEARAGARDRAETALAQERERADRLEDALGLLVRAVDECCCPECSTEDVTDAAEHSSFCPLRKVLAAVSAAQPASEQPNE